MDEKDPLSSGKGVFLLVRDSEPSPFYTFVHMSSAGKEAAGAGGKKEGWREGPRPEHSPAFWMTLFSLVMDAPASLLVIFGLESGTMRYSPVFSTGVFK